MTIYDAAKTCVANNGRIKEKKYITRYEWTTFSKWEYHYKQYIGISDEYCIADASDLSIIRFTDKSLWNEPIGGCTQVKVVTLGPEETAKLWKLIEDDLQSEKNCRCALCGKKMCRPYEADYLGKQGSFMLCHKDGTDKIPSNICQMCHLHISICITRQQEGRESK